MVHAALNYLHKCKIEVSKSYFSFRVKSHFDYPSLVSLTDTFNELEIKYQAVQIEKANYLEVSFPFLALTKSKKSVFEIVDSMQYCEKDNRAFLDRWDGVAIMIEPSQKITNKKSNTFLKLEKTSSNIHLGYIFGFLSILIMFELNNFSFFNLAFQLLSILGATISILIVLFKFGKNNRLTDALCATETKQSCDLVINSKGSKISRSTDLSDLSLLYFVTLFLFLLFNNMNGPLAGSSEILLFPCSIAFIISLISIYYQWRVVKSWCKLCLCISGVIWLQFFAISGRIYQTSLDTSSFSFTLFIQAFTAGIIALSWLLVKPLLQTKNKKEEVDIQLEKWKRNPEIFKLLTMEQSPCNTLIPDNLFYFGKKTAPLHITMVTNPYCKPCASAHQKLAELFKRNTEEISFSIVFTPGNGTDTSDKKYVAVENILSAVGDGNALEILHDWFHSMNIDEWQAKYPPSPLLPNNEILLKRFAEWTVLNRPAFTPAIYLNGYLLPKLYNLEDISGFLFDISSGLLKPPLAGELKGEPLLLSK